VWNVERSTLLFVGQVESDVMNSEAVVRARHPNAHPDFQANTSQIGGHAASASGKWLIFPERAPGYQPIGKGLTLQEAWDDAATGLSKS
jgi:hypothetical protein